MPFSGLRLGPGFCRLNLTIVLVHIQGNAADEVIQTHFVNQSFVWQLVEHQQVVQVRDVVGEDLVAFLHLLLQVAVADKLGTILQETLTSLLGLCSQLLDAIRDFIRILQGLLFSLMIAGKDMSTCYYSIVFLRTLVYTWNLKQMYCYRVYQKKPDHSDVKTLNSFLVMRDPEKRAAPTEHGPCNLQP